MACHNISVVWNLLCEISIRNLLGRLDQILCGNLCTDLCRLLTSRCVRCTRVNKVKLRVHIAAFCYPDKDFKLAYPAHCICESYYHNKAPTYRLGGKDFTIRK